MTRELPHSDAPFGHSLPEQEAAPLVPNCKNFSGEHLCLRNILVLPCQQQEKGLCAQAMKHWLFLAQ